MSAVREPSERGVPGAEGRRMTVEVDVFWNPTTLLDHLSERCARTQGRPAVIGKRDLVTTFESLSWCERCSPEEKRIRIMRGSK